MIRNLRDVEETKKGRARSFSSRLIELLRASIALMNANNRGEVTPEEFEAKAAELKAAVTYHLRERRMRDPDNQRMVNELGRHHYRGNLLRFMDDPRVEPTNNRCERALRPAVIMRKMSQCSKNGRGAVATVAFMSVLETMALNETTEPLVDQLCAILEGAPVRSPT